MSNLVTDGRYRHHEASPDYVHHHLSLKKLEESSSPPPTPKEKDASDKLRIYLFKE